MSYVNNCRTVNGGVVINLEDLQLEVLSHKFHNPNCNIICYYYFDGSAKIELTYFKDIATGRDGHEVYFFKGRDGLQHYRSRCYTIDSLPMKYRLLAAELRDKFNVIDFECYTNRPK
jgi:hypothetical protein